MQRSENQAEEGATAEAVGGEGPDADQARFAQEQMYSEAVFSAAAESIEHLGHARTQVRRRPRKKEEHNFPVEPRTIQVVDVPRDLTNHSYRDFSSVPPEKGFEVPKTVTEMTFAQKVHDILSRPTYKDWIGWLPHGRSFKIHLPLRFEQYICERYFGHKRYSSFLRQLNNHGFKLISGGKDRNSYYHEFMLRGRPHLAVYMPKPKEARRQRPDPAHEPDFYAITALYPVDDDKVDEKETNKRGVGDEGERETLPSTTIRRVSDRSDTGSLSPQASIRASLPTLSAGIVDTGFPAVTAGTELDVTRASSLIANAANPSAGSAIPSIRDGQSQPTDQSRRLPGGTDIEGGICSGLENPASVQGQQASLSSESLQVQQAEQDVMQRRPLLAGLVRHVLLHKQQREQRELREQQQRQAGFQQLPQQLNQIPPQQLLLIAQVLEQRQRAQQPATTTEQGGPFLPELLHQLRENPVLDAVVTELMRFHLGSNSQR